MKEHNGVNGYGQKISHYSSIEALQSRGIVPSGLSLQKIAEVEAVKYFADKKFGPTRLELIKANSQGLVAYFSVERGAIYKVDITKFNEIYRDNAGSLEDCVETYGYNNFGLLAMLRLRIFSKFSAGEKAKLSSFLEQAGMHAEITALIEEARAYNRERLGEDLFNRNL